MKKVQVTKTHVCNPRLHRTEKEFIGVVGSLDIGVVVDHPSQLDGGEVSGQLEAGAGRD